jgi:NAD(P)-dependent dehydrogenase (short-subunit alcohol dehydrogenase family)
MKDFAGKIAFITGGASGAGLGQAKLFGGLGAKVTIVDIRQEAIDKAVAELKGLGIDVLGLQMDLTNRAQYAAAADRAENHWGGPPQLLIQTAGVRPRRGLDLRGLRLGFGRQSRRRHQRHGHFRPAHDQGV